MAADFAWYEAVVHDYGRSWWRRNAAAIDVLDRAPDRRTVAEALSSRGAVVETSVVHQIDVDSWDDDRPELHLAITSNVVRDMPDSAGRKVLAVTMGLPGSGKSTHLRPLAAAAIGVSTNVVDADTVREKFPEYLGGYGSEVVQTETVYVTYGAVLSSARALGSSVIIDTVGNIDHLRDYKTTFPDHDLHLLCADVDLDEAIDRTRDRALRNGRYVRESVVRAAAGRPLASFASALAEGLAKEWALVNTGTSPPTVVEASPLYGPAGRSL